jgi:hypothetical protein
VSHFRRRGLKRRIGHDDLTTEGQDYLKAKKPGAPEFCKSCHFLFNRFNIGPDFSFLLFTQYSPTHFGNDIAVFVPFRIKSFNQLLAVHNYNNHEKAFFGFQYGMYNMKPFVDKKFDLGATLSLWSQPEQQGFYDMKGKAGGALELQAGYDLGKGFSANLSTQYKSSGWMIGNPYLDDKFSFRVGVRFDLAEK